MNQKFIYASVLAFVTNAFLHAQENDSLKVNQLKEIVISDTKFQQEIEKSGKIIEVITANDLKTKQAQSLPSILNQVAGIEINGNQSFNGKNQGIYIRGARNRQVAIYIDGVPVVDASGINFEYDLRLIPVEQIERIEILKGSSSTLYGSGAAAGVINIVLKKASQKKMSGNAFFYIGTQNDSNKKDIDANYFNQGFSVNGTLKKWKYLTSLTNTETKGFSEAKGENFEDDTFSRVNALQKIGFKPNDKLEFTVFGNYDIIKNTFDNPFGGPFYTNDDLNNKSQSEQFRVGLQSTYKYKKGELQFNSNGTSIKRNVDISNSWTNSIDDYFYASKNASAEIVNKYQFFQTLHIITGLQTQFFNMEQLDDYTDVSDKKAHFNILDPYLTLVYNSNFGLNINAGGRLNSHSEYGTNFVYNFNPSYSFKSFPLRIISSYSTAYITPSLYQIYGPYGNLDLQPEENATAEFGFESQFLDKKITINAVGFYRNEQNKIDFFTDENWNSFYINYEDEVNAKGIEINLNFVPNNKIALKTNYTFTEVEENVSRYIPKHKVNINLDYTISKRLTSQFSYLFSSERNDAYFDNFNYITEPVKLKAYKLFNASLAYQLVQNRLDIFGSVTNILNEDFQESIGYNTKGRNFKLGLNFKF